MRSVNLNLYTTLGCHLCEQAKEVLWQLEPAVRVSITEVEIADSEELLARYGVRIPVIAIKDAPEAGELGWPFTADEVLIWLPVSQ